MAVSLTGWKAASPQCQERDLPDGRPMYLSSRKTLLRLEMCLWLA